MEPVSSDMASTSDISLFVLDHWSNESLFPSEPSFFKHPRPIDPNASFVPAPESPVVFRGLSTQDTPDFRNDGNGEGIQTGFASIQDTRGVSVPLDPMMCHVSPGIVAPYTPSGLHSPLMDVMSHGSFPLLPETAAPYKTLVLNMEPTPQAILHAQQTNSMIYHHGDAEAKPDPAFRKNTTLVPSYSSRKLSENVADDEMQSPVVLYRAPEKTASCSRRSQRACAMNIEGLWIDQDDLCSIGQSGSGAISVHQCQWDKFSNPCGMWIIGSRSRINSHIQKWHPRSRADKMAKCLWDGCTTSKAMLRDSLNRHVLTVHLGEGFYCHGCNQVFSRNDVYNLHVRKVESCRIAGFAMVYGTEQRVVDTHQALWLGGAVRYAD